MALSQAAIKKLLHVMTGQAEGLEVINILNVAQSRQAQASAPWMIAAAIVATSVSTTTDFAALQAGDLLVAIPAVAGNAVFESVVAAGTKPSAAVVGSLYLALRASARPAAIATVL